MNGFGQKFLHKAKFQIHLFSYKFLLNTLCTTFGIQDIQVNKTQKRSLQLENRTSIYWSEKTASHCRWNKGYIFTMASKTPRIWPGLPVFAATVTFSCILKSTMLLSVLRIIPTFCSLYLAYHFFFFFLFFSVFKDTV